VIAITYVDSNLTTSPPGPVAVFKSSTQYVSRELEGEDSSEKGGGYEFSYVKESTPIVITCKSSEFNITWDIPSFNFAELADQQVTEYSLSLRPT